jgi:Tol biopolymer transport system component
MFPVWSGNGQTIYFNSGRTGLFELYQKPATSEIPERLVMSTRAVRIARHVSSDGRFLLYANQGAGAIAAVQLDGNPPGDLPVLKAAGANYPQFSPNGRWLAYEAIVNGRTEILLQQFPSGRQVPVSTNGGARVRWRSDNRELFYIAPKGELMAVPVELSQDGNQAQVGSPSVLFTPPIIKNMAYGVYGHQHMVSQDGERFLIATIPEVRSPIMVIRNWQPKP